MGIVETELAKQRAVNRATEAQARALVTVLEVFVDECIASALRQHAPEHAPRQFGTDSWSLNDLYEARQALVKALMPIIAK